MSRIKDYYLNQQEKNPYLSAMQEEMNAINDTQDTWWRSEDSDKDFHKRCDKLMDNEDKETSHF